LRTSWVVIEFVFKDDDTGSFHLVKAVSFIDFLPMFVFSYFFVTDNDESAVFVFEFVESAEMFWIFDEFYFESA